MNEFKNDNDYSVSVFSETEFLVKMAFCHSPKLAEKWLNNSKYQNWQIMNVYARRSGRFIGQFKKGNIPYKPR